MKLKKTSYHLRSWWSSSSNFAAIIGFLLSVQIGCPVQAVTISAIYSSACARETGVIINVDDNMLQLMSLKGVIRTIPRFDIIYVATYPIGSIRIPQVTNPGDSDVFTIKTVFEDQVVDLVTGWMIDHSEEQMSFLTLSGTQSVIDTNDIWDIDINPLPVQETSKSENSVQLEFVHPYPFMHCEKEINGTGTSSEEIHRVYPQYLLAEPLLIKRELDRLKDGYDKIREYTSNKKFYPVPQIYSNDTSLGFWVNLGNRYGSSKNRSNSFIPAIVSETSDGPFGFQSVFITGVAPMPYSIHEEPQIQAYFRMKASYVHFSIMVDFSRFTMGAEKYKWSEDDLETNDNRENETFHLAGGLDFGPFAFDVSVVDFLYYAVRHEAEFHEDDMRLNRGSVAYHNRHFKAELHYGFGDDTKEPLITLPDDASGPEKDYIDAKNEELRAKADFDTSFIYYRFNLDLFSFGRLLPSYSLIYKTLDFTRGMDGDGKGEFVYAAKSLTNAFYLALLVNDDLRVSGYLSLELMEKEYGTTTLDDKSSHSYPKGGLSLALLF